MNYHKQPNPAHLPIILDLLKASASGGEPWQYGSDLAKKSGISVFAIGLVQAKHRNTIMRYNEKHKVNGCSPAAYCLAPDLLMHHLGRQP